MYKNKIITLNLLLALSSCTESVSEQLKQNNLSQTNTTSTTTTSTFKVLNAMPSNFSHFIHDAESTSDGCSISSNSLKAQDYDREDTNIAKDCFLEVEELDLFYQGASLNVSADEGMCEYIVFRPFYFWQYQAGKTSRTVYKVECDETCSANSNCGKYFKTATGSLAGYLTEISLTDDDVNYLCQFDHTKKSDLDQDQNPPNCDEGKITVITHSWSDADSDAFCDATPEVDTTESDCGGEMSACLAGPALDIVDNFPNSTSEIIFNENLTAIDKTYEIPASYDKGYLTNMYAANYMRSCYDTSSDKTAANNFLTSDFLGFNLETFSKIVGTYTTDDQGYFAFPEIAEVGAVSDSYKYTIYASNPFRGAPYKGMPYYGFYCLDRAFDVKAQLRVFIREWDRTFQSTNLFLNKTSDVEQTTRYMDTQDSADSIDCTNQDCYDNDVAYNNFYDWDDFLQSKYPEDWAATDSGDVNLFDYSNDAYSNGTMANINERTSKRINNECSDFNSPYYEYNFPRQGL